MDTALFASLLAHKAWADQELLAALQQLDPQTQGADRHLAIRIFNHIHVVDRIFQAHLQGLPHGYTATNTEETPTLEELGRAVQLVDAWYLDLAGRLSAETLAESLPFVFTDQGSGRMSRAEMLLHIANHGSYHRGAIGRILAQHGIAPPRDILTRFLHDSEPQRRQQSQG